MIFGVLIFGPSDLYDKDQPKTMGYTADIVLNGRWILPRDVANQLPTKPPLFNWLSVPIVRGLHVWKEWAFKFPSTAAGLITLFCITGFQPVRDTGTGWKPAIRSEAGLLAAMLWLASAPTIRCIYLCRPDMLLTMFITAAWMFATMALREPEARRRFRSQLALWLCVGGAALTKGPPALLPVLYIPIAAKLLCGRFSAITRTGVLWGLPLAIVITLAWLVPAYLQDPNHVRTELIGQQMVNRIASRTPEGIAPKPVYYIFTWFNSEFTPWTILVMLALLTAVRRPRRASSRAKFWRWPWVRSPAAPAGIFLVLGLIFFACSAGKRADYLLPLYPAAAMLAGYWLWLAATRVGAGAVRAAIVPLIVGALLALNRLSFGAKEVPPDGSNHARKFAQHVCATVGHDEVAFLVGGYHPIMPLIGRHPANVDPSRAKWVIAADHAAWHPVLVSLPVPNAQKHRPGKLALYRVSDGYLTPAQIAQLAKAVRTDEPDEGPSP